MGLLVEGQWHDKWYDTESTGGKFVRQESQFRNWITADGSAGPTGKEGFKAEHDRYHLYVSYACPWAHRTLIMRELKGLTESIGVSAVHPLMLEHGWTFDTDDLGANGDDLYQLDYAYQLYIKQQPDYTGRVTVPILWDKKTEQIVSNESADIIRMLNTAFDSLGANPVDFYPAELKQSIDEINAWVYPNINNGVYKSGFATTQEAYSEAVVELFNALDKAEQILSNQRYLTGSSITEADWRLFTTLIRFDAVYVQHFKCNIRQIDDYPNLSGYLRDLYQQPGIAGTVNLKHIKQHYCQSHPTINPYGIIPEGPELNLTKPHNRNHL
ncbi:glutathione S-transferase family protein [Marinospirillum insulare]|uniref:Glutathione-dependent reductase n=1 Tax=Marinospirillum insulare TaxID=217169 RepID=A0ABQ5ZYV2_9GAMM|nr:glutathione S-transferase family protein [Marinospirillum insulare]GLR64478.1 glutathione-dependent reductase [Marinospirillum insulare]